MELPQWKMTGETKQIGSYTAYKATMVKEDTNIDWGRMFRRRGRGGNDQKKDSTKTEEKKKDEPRNADCNSMVYTTSSSKCRASRILGVARSYLRTQCRKNYDVMYRNRNQSRKNLLKSRNLLKEIR